MTAPPSANFNYPAHYRLGAGRAAELGALCKQLGVARPLVVTDPGIEPLAFFQAIVERLRGEGLDPTVHSQVRPNPIASDVESGVATYRDKSCDAVVMVGGGSAMDVAKCIALMVDNPGTVFDYEDVGDNYKKADGSRIPPMIALPTTAGTGSEVGRASVIINERSEKKIIFHPQMQPPHVIADPELTAGLPAQLTAFTGMDAYVHCFEAWCAAGYHPMADGIALEGMRLIKEHLPTAVSEGNNLEARTHMILASSMGATAFQKGLGVIHAIAHALGGKLGGHHGMLNAILLPYCMEFNRPAIEERCQRLAGYLGLTPTFDALLDWTLSTRAQLGVPATLAELPGMTDQKCTELAPLAHGDPALGGNPRPATPEDVEGLMRRALHGQLLRDA